MDGKLGTHRDGYHIISFDNPEPSGTIFTLDSSCHLVSLFSNTAAVGPKTDAFFSGGWAYFVRPGEELLDDEDYLMCHINTILANVFECMTPSGGYTLGADGNGPVLNVIRMGEITVRTDGFQMVRLTARIVTPP
jgi:hypothetical protein